MNIFFLTNFGILSAFRHAHLSLERENDTLFLGELQAAAKTFLNRCFRLKLLRIMNVRYKLKKLTKGGIYTQLRIGRHESESEAESVFFLTPKNTVIFL